ncbi:TPA: type 1 fimbrial protein [Citrobacter koseri]|uniref:type 1 fimbrial protein n=1 Tax=Citrobacter TaxID=544 RepID=UPI00190633A3|nr:MULTISPECIES: type 1 fimbrial protein [Citrobacter]ELJ2666018.1 type 1 fimbrial protein [Citrobacter koseri]MBJ8937032.1 type 1 fimbrial protein [Citrobacter koseri]MDM3015598.1 type 1 fimbrial protein [Citrobacter sp. CK189]HAT7566420.1 type 1 fimbrial protein [Citrobacter koseri]HBL6924463.1 type 1 fimbrial protein [Citrobacter koseri]
MFALCSKNILGAGLGVCILFSSSVTAQQITTGGVIHFRGQIVEPPCEVSARQQNIDMTCVNNGQMKTNRFTLQQVTTAPQSLRQIASVRINYLDPQQRLAIMSIEYQ